ncbi:hypothetical protein A3844_20855 [Paenibacillus helianthi]|uniref:GIY-YIG domain-containing protein n=1 Tax=Paenibacillus helianthi TaxID=1349432 RepID=A0ABX3EJR2_9BACL|nr:hypothetical protein A3842_27080 [Paenibacillus sp. P3E]OKP83931.1 hypothetical protein A3844_20855 [Paenibacillus helianthi]
MIRLSVFTLVYNEEGNIYDLYLSITDALKGRIESYFERNYGQTASIWAGVKNSTCTDPKDIFKLMPFY